MSSQPTTSRSNIRMLPPSSAGTTSPIPPPLTVNPAVFTTTDPDDAADDGVYELLRTMDLAMSPAPAEESAVDDFAVLLLLALCYNTRGRVSRTRKDIPPVFVARQNGCVHHRPKRNLASRPGRQTTHGQFGSRTTAHRSLRCK